MDVTPIIAQVWGTLGWFIPLMLLINLLKSPWAKGHIGELLVRLSASWRLNKQTYRRLHNVTLTTPDGTTQIDHVFLSPYGIFVLETKNMRGWIVGGEQQPQWTQQFHKRSFQFQNPLRQNFKHLKALEATLGVAPKHLHSVISFVGSSRFKTPMPANVTQGLGFIRHIKSYRQPVFSAAEVDALLQSLQSKRLAPTRATHRKHVRNLKHRHDPSTQRKCPQCGSALRLRTAKSGPKAGQQFWGCSGFPKCRAIQGL